MKRKDLLKFLKDYQFILMVIILVISVLSISINGIDQGLDLSGGSIIQLQLEKPVDSETMDIVVSILDKRLNIYGVKDVKIRSSGDQNVIVEMAGVKPDEVTRLIGNPGKFEAKIDNETVLSGTDISSVESYEIAGTQWQVPFKVTPEAARNFADKAKGKAGKEVKMYLDGKLISSPVLDEGLATGNPSTDVSVTGAETSPEEAESQAKNILTVLKTGALPVKVSVVGANTVSSELGEYFVNGAMIAGILAIIVVALIIFIRYKNPRLVIPIIITSVSEIVIILGIASIINWNMDLAAIAGLIASVGTGVDDQIVITDEVLQAETTSKKKRKSHTKRTIKNALFIVFASAGTLVAAMLPLAYVGFSRGATGIGMLAGFAFTTIIGVFVGILITRPVYAKFIELISIA